MAFSNPNAYCPHSQAQSDLCYSLLWVSSAVIFQHKNKPLSSPSPTMERLSRSSTTSGHETRLPRENVSEEQDANSPATILTSQWQWLKKLQEEHGTPISDANRQRLEKELTADTCKIYINHLKEKYAKKGESKFMNAIKPVVEGLKAYTDGLNTLTKNSLGLSITWGVIQLMLEVSFELSRLPL